MEETLTAPQDVKSLGFELSRPPIAADPRPLSAQEEEQNLTESIRQKALVNVDVINEILVLRAIDPTSSVKTLVDTLDANYKLSGLAAKNLAKEVAAAAVSITINMPSKDTAPKIIHGSTEVVEVTELTPSPVESQP